MSQTATKWHIVRHAASKRLSAAAAAKRSISKESPVWRAQGKEPPIAALSSRDVELLTRRLTNALARGTPRHMQFRWTQQAADAAVLMLLCMANNQVSVLFQERNSQLAAHGGEISFAGGKADPTDRSLEHTALRETYEELGIPEERVRVVGRLPPVPNKTGSLRVHAMVGVVYGEVDAGKLNVNRDEVHRAFTLPLAHFYDPRMQEEVMFRSSHRIPIPAYASDKPGLRVWGLTAFMLHEVLCRIGSSANDYPPTPKI
ncbi:hypothetical protein EV183_002340 [Coemansia sp. RSA 2336]|nr:hypothetical protein EV183_002340 [Coemansia sp. RSA 2336]